MPEPAEGQSTPPRTWRPVVLWTAGILLVLGMAWFARVVVVPYWQARSAATALANGWVTADGWMSDLGGPDAAVRKLSFYMRLPKWITPNPGAAANALEQARYESVVQKVRKETLSVGYMSGAPNNGLLRRDWLVVAGGTVIMARRPGPGDSPRQLWRGLIKIERAFLVDPSQPETRQWGRGPEYLECGGGCEGLQAGDKIIVFMCRYDGGIAIRPVLGSNCLIGVKVDTWDDPIVPAVDALCKTKNLKAALKDPRTEETWRRFDSIGVEAILREKSWAEIYEERQKREPEHPL